MNKKMDVFFEALINLMYEVELEEDEISDILKIAGIDPDKYAAECQANADAIIERILAEEATRLENKK